MSIESSKIVYLRIQTAIEDFYKIKNQIFEDAQNSLIPNDIINKDGKKASKNNWDINRITSNHFRNLVEHTPPALAQKHSSRNTNGYLYEELRNKKTDKTELYISSEESEILKNKYGIEQDNTLPFQKAENNWKDVYKSISGLDEGHYAVISLKYKESLAQILITPKDNPYRLPRNKNNQIILSKQ